jgi:hypothetical protein
MAAQRRGVSYQEAEQSGHEHSAHDERQAAQPTADPAALLDPRDPPPAG